MEPWNKLTKLGETFIFEKKKENCRRQQKAPLSISTNKQSLHQNNKKRVKKSIHSNTREA